MALDPLLRDALQTLLTEIVNGPPGSAAYMLNGGDPGLLGSLEKLSAAEASARPNGRASVAAHVDHVRYGFEPLNRSLREANPFADADWAASWSRHTVTDAEWRERRDALAREARAWLAGFDTRTEWDPVVLAGTIGSIAHLTYHLGAIRQLAANAVGPPDPGVKR